MKSISIIIRTKNEERWISHCLAMIYKQTLQDFEVVLVDNKSDDHTVEIAKRYSIDHFVNIDEFFPGRALNEGIRASHGKYIVCLSAHCIPKDEFWLETLRKNFEQQNNLAGVYGRQLPVSFTDPVDKRDLLIVFGLDHRIQKKDYFFHNANSMLPRKIWEQFPFDEQVTNIEDRIWGKQVIEAGYQIAYEPEAAVFHYHGLHQSNDPKRAKGVVSILERVDTNVLNQLPRSMHPENAEIAAIIPIASDVKSDRAIELIQEVIDDLTKSEYVSDIYLVAEEDVFRNFEDCKLISRRKIDGVNEIPVDTLLQRALEVLEAGERFPELILYVNYEYFNRPEGIFDLLVVDALENGLDTVFAAVIDYGHYWYRENERGYVQTDASLDRRVSREPIYRALYGVGTITSCHSVRRGRLIGTRIGIIPIEDQLQRYQVNKIH